MFSLKKIDVSKDAKTEETNFDFLNIKAAQNMKTEMIIFLYSFIKAKKLKNNNTERTTTIS